jgi:hypothetical protein
VSEPIFIKLGPASSDKLRRLGAKLGESEPAVVVSRALALLEALEPFLKDGKHLAVHAPDDTNKIFEFELTRKRA